MTLTMRSSLAFNADSRTPSAEIARRVGVAERTVRARIDRLVQDEVVRLVALVSPEALGYTVTADVFLEVELGRVQEVAELSPHSQR